MCEDCQAIFKDWWEQPDKGTFHWGLVRRQAPESFYFSQRTREWGFDVPSLQMRKLRSQVVGELDGVRYCGNWTGSPFSSLFFNWRMIALQCSDSFCWTTWISLPYAYIPSVLSLLPTPTPSHPFEDSTEPQADLPVLCSSFPGIVLKNGIFTAGIWVQKDAFTLSLSGETGAAL